MPAQIEAWDGDMGELVPLIRRTWRTAYSNESYYDFDEAYLRSHLESPCTDHSRLFGIYETKRKNKRLVAFLAFMNRCYHFKGQPVTGVFTTFLSVDPDKSGKLLGATIVRETLLKMKDDYEAGGEPAIICFYVDVSHKTDRLFRKISRDCSVALHKIRRVHFGFRPLEGLKSAQRGPFSIAGRLIRGAVRRTRSLFQNRPANITSYGPEHLQDCLVLANEMARTQTFSPYWNEQLLAHQLSCENIHRTYVVRRDTGHLKVSGFLNMRIMGVNERSKRKKIAMIDWVSDAHLNEKERNRLYGFAFHETKLSGCAGALLPFVPALDTLRSPAFRQTTRCMDLYCYNFDPENIPLEGISDAYDLVT